MSVNLIVKILFFPIWWFRQVYNGVGTRQQVPVFIFVPGFLGLFFSRVGPSSPQGLSDYLFTRKNKILERCG
jgi:hypothetical protein